MSSFDDVPKDLEAWAKQELWSLERCIETCKNRVEEDKRDEAKYLKLEAALSNPGEHPPLLVEYCRSMQDDTQYPLSTRLKYASSGVVSGKKALKKLKTQKHLLIGAMGIAAAEESDS